MLPWACCQMVPEAALSSQTSGIEDCCNSASRVGVGTDCLRPTSLLRCCRCKVAKAPRCKCKPLQWLDTRRDITAPSSARGHCGILAQ